MSFHSEFGTVGGVVGPEVNGLAVEPVADRRPLGWALVADGVFVVPKAFLVGPANLILRTNGSPRGALVPVPALPPRSAQLPERGPAAAVLVARDQDGNVREELPYREQD